MIEEITIFVIGFLLGGGFATTIFNFRQSQRLSDKDFNLLMDIRSREVEKFLAAESDGRREEGK